MKPDIGLFKAIAEPAYRCRQNMQVVSGCLFMDIALEGAVATTPASLQQMEQYFQKVFPLVREWLMGKAAWLRVRRS
jgi:hypothetical protein